MPLSKKESKKIDEIENAVKKQTPVERLNRNRKDCKSGKQGDIKMRMMGEMIPPRIIRPGIADSIRDTVEDVSNLFSGLFTPPLMGVIVPPPHRRKWKETEPGEADNSSGEKQPKTSKKSDRGKSKDKDGQKRK